MSIALTTNAAPPPLFTYYLFTYCLRLPAGAQPDPFGDNNNNNNNGENDNDNDNTNTVQDGMSSLESNNSNDNGHDHDSGVGAGAGAYSDKEQYDAAFDGFKQGAGKALHDAYLDIKQTIKIEKSRQKEIIHLLNRKKGYIDENQVLLSGAIQKSHDDEDSGAAEVCGYPVNIQ